MAGTNADGSSNGTTVPGAAKVGTTMTPDQLAAMNQQTQGYKDQTAALQAQINAQTQANAAGPQMQYNPLDSNGSLKDNYKLGNANTYTDALMAQQHINDNNSRNMAAQQAQTGIAQSKENLAMRGGVGANNSALLEAQGLKQGLANQQGASNQAAQNEAAIGVQGAGANLKIDQANLQNQLTAGQNVNAFNLDKYNQNMAVKAANDQANATTAAANSGKK